jgi:hypothetical protein
VRRQVLRRLYGRGLGYRAGRAGKVAWARRTAEFQVQSRQIPCSDIGAFLRHFQHGYELSAAVPYANPHVLMRHTMRQHQPIGSCILIHLDVSCPHFVNINSLNPGGATRRFSLPCRSRNFGRNALRAISWRMCARTSSNGTRTALLKSPAQSRRSLT